VSLTERLGLPLDRGPRCLAIGAHPDDIEIGAGGTILRLIAERPDTEFRWVILSGVNGRADEADRSARSITASAATLDIRILGGRDGYLPYEGAADTKESLAATTDPPPDLVLVHRHDDAHQDHRFAADLAWQLCRSSTILEYEIPKWEGDLASNNLYVELDAEVASRKVGHLVEAFPSQSARHWYTEETFRALLRLRGNESRAPSGMAEAFLARKLVI